MAALSHHDVSHANERLKALSRELEGKALDLYWVGDGDVYCARSVEEAYEIHISLWGEHTRWEVTTEDVALVDEISLDSPNRRQGHGVNAPSLREVRSEMKAPGPVALD